MFKTQLEIIETIMNPEYLKNIKTVKKSKFQTFP